MKSYEEINWKIKNGIAVVLTAEEIIKMVDDVGIKETAKRVDVVTTGTFGPMCSTGAFLNFGQTSEPTKMSKIWLNDVPAYGGVASADAFIGATELREGSKELYGGAHVIEDLISGKRVKLKVEGTVTDCKPNKNIEMYIDKNNINECVMFNPRNAYQNYVAATNSTDETIYTYMGKLLPNHKNITYCNAGELSPLINDPYMRTIGVGTKIFLGGTEGYVAWNGTQFKTVQKENENGVPIGPTRTLSVIGDMKKMNTNFMRALSINKYGVSMAVGIGIPIPILDEEMVGFTMVRDRDIKTNLVDYGIRKRDRPIIREINYEELKSGLVDLNGKKIPTSSISSMYKARVIANTLKQWIEEGKFTIEKPVKMMPEDSQIKPLT